MPLLALGAVQTHHLNRSPVFLRNRCRTTGAAQRSGFPHWVCSRNCALSTLPAGFFGSGSGRMTRYCGTLKSARCSAAKVTSSSGSTVCPGRGTTTAPTFSPIIGSGTPRTATSASAREWEMTTCALRARDQRSRHAQELIHRRFVGGREWVLIELRAWHPLEG